MMGGLGVSVGLQIVGGVVLGLLWQGTLIAAALAIALRLGREMSPEVRYTLSWLGLFVLLALPVRGVMQVHTLWSGHQHWVEMTTSMVEQSPVRHGVSTGGEGGQAAIEGLHDDMWPTRISGGLAAALRVPLQLLALFWITGAALLVARLLSDLVAVHRLRMTAGGPPEWVWVRSLARVRRKMRIRQRMDIRLSEHVEVPSLIGWLRPLLLVPAGVDKSLPEEGIEAILAHELAHVRRRDFAANLVQGLVEIPLFFHPAARWISGRIREERECACDAMAACATKGGVIAYIKALLDLEGMRAPSPTPALGISGGDLLRRVRRLTKAGVRSRPARALSVGVAGIAAVALLALGFWMERPSTYLSVTLLMKQDLAAQQIVVSEGALQSSSEHEMEMQRMEEMHAGR